MNMNKSNTVISEILDLEAMFERYGLNQLPEDRKKEIETKISQLFEKRVSLRLLGMMTEEQKKKAENIEDDDLYSFLEKEGVDVGTAMVAEAAEFGGELIEYLSYVKGLIDGKSA